MDVYRSNAARAIEKNDHFTLNQIYEELCGTYILYNKNQLPAYERLLSLHYSGTLHRNIGAEVFLPSRLKGSHDNSVAIRSESSGNCLYSSASLSIVGNEALTQPLRILTSLELFLHASFYCEHPTFLNILLSGQVSNTTAGNLLCMSVSHHAVDTNKTGVDLIRAEAALNLEDCCWSGYLCLLALSSVTRRKIHTYYPDFGQEKYRVFFNQSIDPRIYSSCLYDLHILFCFDGILTHNSFQHNHYVPVLFIPKRKHKLSVASEKTDSLHLKKEKILKIQSSVAPITMLSEFISSTSSISSNFSSLTTVQPTTVITKNKDSSDALGRVRIASSLSQTTINFKPLPKAIFPKPSVTKQPERTIVSTNTSTSAQNISYIGGCNIKTSYDVNPVRPIPSSTDIAVYKDSVTGISDKELYDFYRNTFSPDDTYVFPRTNNRRFLVSWLKQFSWLRYSPSIDGTFCIACVLFGHRFSDRAHKMKLLFTEPFRRWCNAQRFFRDHQSSKNGLHAFTMPVLHTLESSIKGNFKSIEVIIDSQVRSKIAKNRAILSGIVDAIILCGRTNSSLRGHRDDHQYHPIPGSYSDVRTGCFNEFLHFAVRNGNHILKDHLESCARNATYISKTSQNILIKCCGEEISENILSEVKKCKFYSLIADEVCDCSTKQQLSLVLRFVDSDFNIREDFIRFVLCNEGLSGRGLFEVLYKCVTEDLKLDVMNCRGQGYDGAGSVSGHINGLSAHVLRLNPKAFYFHCQSHKLNLSISESCHVELVSEMFDKVKELSYFFNNSEPRQRILEAEVLRKKGKTSKTKLKDVCRTRWVERIEGLSTFLDLFPAIVNTLKEMTSPGRCNRDTRNKASTYLSCIQSFKFVFTLVVTSSVFDFTLPVTRLLQSRSIDILDGLHLITALKNTLISTSVDIENFHQSCYDTAVALSDECDIDITKPRTCSRQINRSNIPSYSTVEYYRRNVTVPLIDHVKVAVNSRFNTDSIVVYKGLSLIPANMINLLQKNNGEKWKEDALLFAKCYEDDLPSFNCLGGELNLWEKYWQTYSGSLPHNITSTLKSISFPGFENIKVILRILGTLPVTSCESERSFSALRRLKEYSRSTMSEDRLNGLALLYIHQEIVPDVCKVIDRYAVLGNHHLEFI